MSAARGTLIVTGASRGIGAAIAYLAAKHGFAIAVNYSSDAAGAQEVARKIQEGGGNAAAFRANVAKEDDVASLFAEAERSLGPIAGLVNNAGITGSISRLEDMKAADIVRVLAINITGTILCSREAVRRLSRKRGGKGGAIVNLSSRASELGSANEWVHYAASKGAVNSFTIGLAREVAAEGIRVNAVSPGLIDTGIHAAAGVPDRVERMAHLIPAGRPGTAGEVANAVLWLLSDEASYITGAILPVGGGR